MSCNDFFINLEIDNNAYFLKQFVTVMDQIWQICGFLEKVQAIAGMSNIKFVNGFLIFHKINASLSWSEGAIVTIS